VPGTGLDPAVVAERAALVGPNELGEAKRPTLPAMVWDAVTEPFVMLLFAAGVLAVVLGEVRDGLLVLLGLIPIVGADVLTTYRSEQALESLREAAAPHARVRRAGVVGDVLASALVPGDIVPSRPARSSRRTFGSCGPTACSWIGAP
jgi:Ca2+-transporting ATPase